MKRSEKEAEIRKLLEMPGAVVLLPDGMSVLDAVSMPINELVNRLVYEATPVGGWEPEGLPHRLQVKFTLGPYIVPVGRLWDGADDQANGLQAAVDAYNAMKEAEEAEADPDDPLTAGLQKLAQEEIEVLVRDAARVTKEETIRQLAGKSVSRYTREEFVAAEMQMALGPENTGDIEDIDPDALAAIRKRAEWNARAAERAGVVWRRTAPACECRLCKKQRDEKQAEESATSTDDYSNRVAPSGHNKAWIHYCDSGLVANHRMPRETFNAGFDYGYQAGWRARMDTLNPVCSPEAADEVVDETTQEDSRISRLEANTTANSEQLCALSVATRKSDEDLERRINHHMDKLDELERRLVGLEVGTQESTRHLESNLRELRDLGQRALDKLDRLEESIDGAHDRLQRHDVRITKAEEQIRTFIQPTPDNKKGD